MFRVFTRTCDTDAPIVGDHGRREAVPGAGRLRQLREHEQRFPGVAVHRGDRPQGDRAVRGAYWVRCPRLETTCSSRRERVDGRWPGVPFNGPGRRLSARGLSAWCGRADGGARTWQSSPSSRTTRRGPSWSRYGTPAGLARIWSRRLHPRALPCRRPKTDPPASFLRRATYT